MDRVVIVCADPACGPVGELGQQLSRRDLRVDVVPANRPVDATAPTVVVLYIDAQTHAPSLARTTEAWPRGFHTVLAFDPSRTRVPTTGIAFDEILLLPADDASLDRVLTLVRPR